MYWGGPGPRSYPDGPPACLDVPRDLGNPVLQGAGVAEPGWMHRTVPSDICVGSGFRPKCPSDILVPSRSRYTGGTKTGGHFVDILSLLKCQTNVLKMSERCPWVLALLQRCLEDVPARTASGPRCQKNVLKMSGAGRSEMQMST